MPEPSASAPPAGPTLTIVCLDEDYAEAMRFTISRLYPDFSQAWATNIPSDKHGQQNCSEEQEDDGQKLKPLTAAERAAWNSPDSSGERWTITIPYGQCVQHDSPEYKNSYPDAPNLADEAKTMLTLCPNHPNGNAMRKRMGIQEKFGQQILKGETIQDGTWRVGAQVQPGNYKARGGGVFDCYWARHDAKGNAIQSGFSKQESGEELRVTIEPGDFSFYTEGCGPWFRLD